jgi:hypothetical protein
MADDKRIEGRTTYIEENMKDGVLKDLAMKVSKMGDAVGFTQEDKYKGKTREEVAKKSAPEKKRAGGAVKSSASKRADGIATKGKTRGRMV